MLSAVGLWPGTCCGSNDDWLCHHAVVPSTGSHSQLRVLHSGWSVMALDVVLCITRVPTGQSGKTGKNQGIRVVRESQWKIFFGKVRENDKLVRPDVRFSG